MIDLNELRDEIGFKPGVYFGLPEADYHADKALGGSNIKKLLTGPMDYQASSWMNPAYVPPQSRSMRFGSADHKCILEGEKAFRAEYYKPIEPGFLNAVKDFGSAEIVCQALHIDLPNTILETSEIGVAKVAMNMMRKQIETAYKQSCGDKERLTVAEFNRILWNAHAIRNSPYRQLFEADGFPEVSIFWRLKNGIPLKCRIDRLSLDGALQWKTTANTYNIAFEDHCNRQFIRQNHHVESAHYVEGMQAAYAMMAVEMFFDCYTDEGREEIRTAKRQQHQQVVDVPEFCKEFYATGPDQYLIAYHDSGLAPNIVTRTYDHAGRHEYVRRAVEKRNQALRVYLDCMERFGPKNPWYPEPNVKRFDDADFSTMDLES